MNLIGVHVNDGKFAGIVEKTMQRYNMPAWLKPYIYSYIKSNPLSAIKHATSFIEIRRKKGEITREYVRLPNGLTFDIKFINEILSLFYYGEERIGSIYARWSKEPGYENSEYKKRFAELSVLSKKHQRAIRNLMQGIGITPVKPRREVIEVFDYVESTSEWHDRILISGLFIKYSYSYPFAFVFYKVFYPVAPEFMRSFGKAFTADDASKTWLDIETKRIVKETENGHLMELARNVLTKTAASINSEVKIAKENKVEPEVKLLRDISVAYPLHMVSEFGVQIDPDKEAKDIIKKI